AAAGAGAERLAASTAHCRAVRHGPPLGDVEWRELMTSSQLSLVTLKESAAHTCVPSKAYSALAAGSALIAVAPERSDLAALVRRHRCGAVVSPGDVDGLVDALRQFVDDPARLDEARRRARAAAVEAYGIRRLAERWESFLRSVPAPSQPWYPVMKRALDVIVAGGTLITLSPLLAAIAAAVGVTMGRPILFSQERPGVHGRTFRLLKFRTMRTAGPGELGPEADAARLTRLGKLLRSTSLDELPSLINVLRGEMSLVGPRPLLVRYLRRYTREQARRHDVVPGLTGWAQVNGRNALSWKEKFDLDVWYVDHRSFLLDLHILFRTALTVLRRDGISQDGHVTMPEFMGTEEIAA